MNRVKRAAAIASIVALLSSCGGGGGGGDSTGTPGGSNGSISTGSNGGDASSALPRIEPYDKVAPQVAKAQLTSSVASAATVTATPVRLGPMATPKSMAQPAAAGGDLHKIGQGRDIAAAADAARTAALLNWQPTADGGRAAAIAFSSEGAAAVRLGLVVKQLPATARVRAYAPGAAEVVEVSGAQIAATLARNAAAGERGDAASTFWMPPVTGPDATLEIDLPPGVDPATVSVAVPRLSHLWVDLSSPKADAFLKIGEAGSCNVDATCSAEFAAENRAVARMQFQDGADAFLCTGTLMADTAASGTPYLLSASHCISSQSAASTLSTWWFYQSASCNVNVLSPSVTRVDGGATLLQVSAESDSVLLQLDRQPPDGVRFAGSLLGKPAVGNSGTGLHHPRGDLLKISQGSIADFAACSGGTCSSLADGNFMAMRWASGTTESGSSGSALFATVASKHYVTGHLFAGSASCAAPNDPDYYGRLDVAYRAGFWNWLGNVPGAR